jgi:hypothetical protein
MTAAHAQDVRTIAEGMMVGILQELYDAFRRVNGYALSAIGVLVSLAGYAWLPDTRVSLRLLLPPGILCLVLILTLWDATVEANRRRARLPRVRRAIPPTPLYSDARAILLLDKSELFSQDAMVSVFSKSNDFEVYAGVGFVAVVQEDGLIQVCVQMPRDDEDDVHGELWVRVMQNNVDELANLRVKPSFSRNLIG